MPFRVLCIDPVFATFQLSHLSTFNSPQCGVPSHLHTLKIMSKLTRTNAIFTYPTLTDLSGHIGSPISLSRYSGVDTVTLYDPNDTDVFGVLVYADATQATIVPVHGGLAGTVKIKVLDEAQTTGLMYAARDGAEAGFALVDLETYSGTWDKCAIAMEGGVAGELIEAIITTPTSFTLA